MLQFLTQNVCRGDITMKKILIVDDEKISLLMTNHILSTEYNTICATSGKEAIELYHKERPDMILSDLRMPGMSGYELQSTLQEQYHERIPFMFMTADSDHDAESKGFANGAMDFIRKPFRADVLLKRVGNILHTVEQIQGLRWAAVTDPMTGLLNKTSSQDEINTLCRSTPGVLMMIDLDSFKLVNDIYGHSMGDKILIRFAEIIQSVVRDSDLTGRLGGDEFIAFCQNITDESVIANKAAYINEQILLSAREYMGEDMTIPLGASIGCVFAPDEGTDFATLYKKADKALYTVKQNGKHGYNIYKNTLHTEARKKSDNNDLMNAMKILNERNQAPGAYTLSFEQFRIVYRFLVRMIGNYKKPVCFLLFSIDETHLFERPLEEATDAFLSVLRSSLRQSDVVTQSGTNQFMVLLLKTPPYNLEIVINRIMHNWIADGGEPDCIFYEPDSLRPNTP